MTHSVSTALFTSRVLPILLAALVLFSTAAEAQFPGGGGGTGGGRQRGGGDKANSPRNAPDKAASHGAAAADPIAAIYRELPSLKEFEELSRLSLGDSEGEEPVIVETPIAAETPGTTE